MTSNLELSFIRRVSPSTLPASQLFLRLDILPSDKLDVPSGIPRLPAPTGLYVVETFLNSLQRFPLKKINQAPASVSFITIFRRATFKDSVNQPIARSVSRPLNVM